MWAKSNVFRVKRKTVAYVVAILIAVAGVTPVLADYLGPNRTVTETVTVCKVLLKECKLVNGAYKYKTVNSWSCSLESKPWKAYSGSSATCNAANKGYQYWTTSSTQKEVTNTYPPATVSSELQNCTLNNGWCNTVPQLVVSGDEPVSGYDIFAIEGSLNGQNFACSDDSCIVPLNEGNNTVDYWALSSWGDSSLKGTFVTKVDSQAPNITGTVSGVSGSNGWYLSPISVNGLASDATSGLAKFTCTLDDTALGSCSSITVNSDGPHTLVLTASDNAGNSRTLNQTASIDTQNPTLTASLNGTSGSNSWYTAAALNAAASDPTPGSGLAAIEYNIDNSGWIAFPDTGELALPGGKHTVDIRALDNAGRSVSSSKTFWLDSAAPDISLDPKGTLGTNGWYTTAVNLSASTADEISGVDVFEYSLDSGTWTPYTVPLTLTDGTHNISFWSQDQAGLVKQVDSTLQIDTRPPQIAGNISGVLGSNDWYTSDVALSASASDPTPGSGLDAFTYILNGGAPTPYTSPVNLSDGQHTIQFNAQDQAGSSYSIDQNIKVDTVHPALTISSAFPNWVKDTVTINGTASDNGSGISKVEISTDGAQNWQLVTGTASWSFDWNTQSIPDGSYSVRVRVVDQAGLSTEQTVNIKSDNHAPEIRLPDSWLQWSAVSLDVWDDFSGISEARVEISDPENRYPKRVIELDPNQFPLSFKWDRRFGNNEVAPSGTYDVKVIASDNLGHTAKQNASVKVVLSILPSGPTATPQSYVRAASTPIPTYTALPNSSPTVTPTAVISGFGDIEPTAQATSTPAYVPTPRATPTQTSVLDWLESFFSPNTNSTNSSTEIKSPDSAESHSSDSQSNILWGAAAAAMVGAATSYAQEERRKQQEEKERRAALEKEAEERHDKMQARKLEKAEAKRAQEKAWEEARNQQQDFIGGVAAKLDRMDAQEEANWIAAQAAIRQKYEEKKQQEYTIPGVDRKIDRMDEKEEAERLAAQAAIRQKNEEKKKAEEEQLQAGLAAYYAATRPEEPANWWEKTKSFVRNEIIEPVNTHIYQPFIQPAVDQTKEFIKSESAWVNENIYQPYIAPAVEKTKQFVSVEGAWLNENIYQPYIKPALNKTMETVGKDLSWLNKNVYQPYLQPAINTFNEKVYQPYVKPVLDKAKELITTGASWINDNVYQPYIQPAVNYIDQHIYAPIFEPVVDDLSSLWDKYGDWVHSALDTVGFIPGLGDIADGLNGLIYLGEGRYIEAGVSALAMIPLLGDLGKAGKWGIEIGAEVVEEVVEEVAEKVVKEVAEEVVEDVVKETVEEVAEKVVIEAGEELAEQTTREALEQVTEKALQESGEELASKVVKESVEEGAEKVLKETTEKLTENTIKESSDEFVAKAVNETTQAISETSAEQVSEAIAEQAVKEAVEDVDEKTAQLVLSLKEKYGDQATDKFLRFCEKYDINPYEVLTRPPAEGQSLIGWGLGIDNAANPANHALMELNLTEEELKKILERSTVRPDSKIVVLGFGNTAKPYYALSDEIEGCHLSLPPEVWAPFENAKANFLVDINIPFVEKGIEERKVFIFNVDTDLITDPANARRFSLPELRLLEMEKNNYVNVPIGKYNAFVPEEMLDTFQQMLPAKLFE